MRVNACSAIEKEMDLKIVSRFIEHHTSNLSILYALRRDVLSKARREASKLIGDHLSPLEHHKLPAFLTF